MNPWYVVAAALFVAWLGGMAYYLLRAEGRDAPTVEVPVPAAPETRAPGEVLVPAPRIGDVTLRDWLIHRYNRDNVWREVVAEFYTAAAADPEIAAKFAHLGEAGMARLQKHFLSALLVLTHTGLTVGALNAMRTKHARLDITAPVFDRTILALAGVLESKGVPGPAVEQLLPAVDLLRGAIVVGPRDVPMGPRHRRAPAS